jgi:hypothetical protein
LTTEAEQPIIEQISAVRFLQFSVWFDHDFVYVFNRLDHCLQIRKEQERDAAEIAEIETKMEMQKQKFISFVLLFLQYIFILVFNFLLCVVLFREISDRDAAIRKLGKIFNLIR